MAQLRENLDLSLSVTSRLMLVVKADHFHHLDLTGLFASKELTDVSDLVTRTVGAISERA